MKKILNIMMLMLACIFIVGVTDVDAQYGKKKKKKKKVEQVEDDDYFDESGGKLIDKLWYGGGLTLGYGGNNTGSLFAVGVSPMVGYKVSEKISFGPRVVLDYNSLRVSDNFGKVYKGKSLTYGVGIFGRLKLFQSLFLHTEYAVLNESLYDTAPNGSFLIDPNDPDKLATQRIISNNFYIGGGYFSGGGGGLGYEVVLLYNVLAPDDVVAQPLDLRIGFTWGF